MRFSLELLPVPLLRGAAGTTVSRLMPQLPKGTLVYLPNLPADPPDAIELAIRHLHETAPQLEPVPHIAAARVRSEAELLRTLDSWQLARGRAEISEVRRYLCATPAPLAGVVPRCRTRTR